MTDSRTQRRAKSTRCTAGSLAAAVSISGLLLVVSAAPAAAECIDGTTLQPIPCPVITTAPPNTLPPQTSPPATSPPATNPPAVVQSAPPPTSRRTTATTPRRRTVTQSTSGQTPAAPPAAPPTTPTTRRVVPMTVAPPVERQPDDAVAAVQNVGSAAAEDESGRGALIPSPVVALVFLLVGCLALLLTISAPGLRARMRPARLDDGVKKNRA